MSPCGVGSFPLELLHEVCSYLCWRCQGKAATSEDDRSCTWTRDERTSLLNLTKTSRSLRAAARPFLYHSLHTVNEGDLYFIARTLAERPDLRRNVLDVEITHGGVVPAASAQRGPCPFLTDVSRAVDIQLRARVGKKDRIWALRYRDRVKQVVEYGVLVSMLLLRTPQLERAHIRVPVYPAFEDLSQSDVPLTLLKTLTFSAPGGHLELDSAAPIIRLAGNLEVLHLHHIARLIDISSGAFVNRAVADTEHMLHNITELSLIDMDLDLPEFRMLFSAVGPKLTSVTINPRRPAMTSRCGTHRLHRITLSHALNTLWRWPETLKKLAFYYRPGCRVRRSHDERLLRHFSALELVHLSAGLLKLGLDSNGPPFPPTLRELTFLGSGLNVDGLDNLLTAQLAGFLPSLRRIEVEELHLSSGFSAHDRLRELAAAAEEEGIEFVIHPRSERSKDDEEWF